MRLTLKNFKNYLEASFELEGITAIEGENGSGKTSVLEAILFALYGRDFYGNIAVDGYLRKGQESFSVRLDYNGNSYRRVYGKDSLVYYNGARLRQMDLASKLPELDLAYCIVNPLYMLNKNHLALRSLFMQRIPLPDPVEIFKKEYSKREDLLKRFSSTSYEESKALLKDLLASQSAMRRELEVKEAELFSCESQRQEISSKRVRMPTGVVKRERERQQKIDDLSRKIEALGDVVTAQREVKDRLEIIKREVLSLAGECGVSNLTELRGFYEDGYKKIMDEYRRLEVLAFQLGGARHKLEGQEKCPMCGSEVVWEEFVKRNESELLITKTLMERLKPDLDAFKEALVQVRKYKSEVDELNSRLVGLKIKVGTYRNYKKKIEQLRDLQRGLSEKAFKDAVESEAQARMLKNLASRKTFLKKGVVALKQAVKDNESLIKDAQLVAEAHSPKGVAAFQAAHVGEVIVESLKDYFPGRKVEVFTARRNKSNDNFREVFEVRIDNVLWSELSFGERIVISIVMGLLLREEGFPLKFVLLDEASVLSSKTRKRIEDLLSSKGVDLYYTLAKDHEFKLRKYSNG